MTRETQLRRIRILIAIVIGGLIISGLSAFPLRQESAWLDHIVHSLNLPSALTSWTAQIHLGLERSYANYPFLAYGTDWLAFGHLVIAIFMMGAYFDPVRNRWLLRAGMIACLLVVPTALLCGSVRGIPFWWQLVDSSFGIFGFIPLWFAARMIKRL